MPELSRIYTGQNAGAPVYQGNKALTALNKGLDNLMEAKKTDLAYAKQEEKDFTEAMQVDPVALMDEQMMERQASNIEAFQDRWTQVMAERQGKLTMRDKAMLASEQRKLKADQQMWQMSNNLLLNDMRAYAANPSKFDGDWWKQKQKEAFETGVYRGDGLSVAPLTSGAIYERLINAAKTGDWAINEDTVGNTKTRSYVSPHTPEDAKKLIEGVILGDDAAWKGAWEEFDADKSLRKQEIVDMVQENNNNQIDTGSEKKNAVLEYYNDKYANLFLKREPDVISSKETVSEQRDEQKKDAMKIENLMVTGFAPTSQQNGWRVGKDGLQLSYKLGTPMNRGYWIDADKIDLPKGAVVDGGMVYVRPTEIKKDGTIVMGAMTGKMEELPDQKIAEGMIAWGEPAAKDFIRGKDGKLYKLKKGSTFDKKATSTVSRAGDDIFKNFPKLDEAWDALDKGNEGSLW